MYRPFLDPESNPRDQFRDTDKEERHKCIQQTLRVEPIVLIYKEKDAEEGKRNSIQSFSCQGLIQLDES